MNNFKGVFVVMNYCTYCLQIRYVPTVSTIYISQCINAVKK